MCTIGVRQGIVFDRLCL